MSQFHKLSIKEVIKETSSAVSLVFDIPSELQSVFSFEAGQYITLKTIINGEDVRRAYSLCSSPKSGEIKVAVKAVENGTFSVHANETLKAGDTLEVAVPEGKFVLNAEANKNYIGFCAGSGITPVLAMVKSVLESDTNATFTLVYGNKSASETIFYDEINALAEANPDQLTVNYIYSREKVEGGLSGRINKGHVDYFTKNKSFDKAFLCGPEQMIEVVSETLQANGFEKANVLFELFTSSESTETIATEVSSNGETEITVILDDEETTFTMKQSDDVLSASLRNKLDAPYSCQGGICSSCLCKVTEGEAKMIKNHILNEDEVADGFVLACQARPITPKITIDFDDV